MKVTEPHPRYAWLFDAKVVPEATLLTKVWAVRPAGSVGTMGYSPVAWEVVYVTRSQASDAQSAITRARKICRAL